jgi:hypothetical protein
VVPLQCRVMGFPPSSPGDAPGPRITRGPGFCEERGALFCRCISIRRSSLSQGISRDRSVLIRSYSTEQLLEVSCVFLIGRGGAARKLLDVAGCPVALSFAMGLGVFV